MGKDAKKSGNRKPLAIHDLANIPPLMSDLEFKSLKASIQLRGQDDAVVLLDGKIIDGRNRDRACVALGIKTITRRYDPKRDGPDPREFVLAKLINRSLSKGQWAITAARHLAAFKTEAAKRQRVGKHLSPKTGEGTKNKGKAADFAAERYPVGRSYIESAATLLRDAPDLAELVHRGEKSLSEAFSRLRINHRRAAVIEAAASAPTDWEKNCTFLCGDVVEQLETLPAQSVGCIVTDPPYNLKKKYHADETGDARADREYIEWCAKWLSECKRILTPDGTIFVMNTARYIGRLDVVMRDLGLHYRNTAYWWENNPENQGGNFSDAVRPVLYFTRSLRGFVFNEDCRVDSRRNKIADKRGLDIGVIPDNVWIENRIPGNSGDRVPFEDAPPQIPVSIPELCIRVASDPGDTILDPFNGNGTTAIAALLAGRKYIGIDQSKKYLDQSRIWIPAQLGKLRKVRAV